MALYWLSFCDAKKPPGTQFLGACIVDGNAFSNDDRIDAESAISSAWRNHCNPGGEVIVVRISAEKAALIPEAFKNVLLSKERIAQFEAVMSAGRNPQRPATPVQGETP